MSNIPRGYKQTEVGIIPSDWEVKKLGLVADVTKLAGFEYSNYFNSYNDGGDIIVIRGTNITHNKLDLSDIKTIPRETANKLPRSKLKINDLVFAYVGTIGPVYLIEENDKYHLGPNTSKITASNQMIPEFVFHYFTSWLIKNEITEHTSIGAQPSLSMSKIRRFRIIIPPAKAEQTAIATALSDADALISRLEELIAKKRNVKQGAMQELLTGKKRLPGFSGEWEVRKLGELCDYQNGTSLEKYFNQNDGYKVISIGNYSTSGKYIENNTYISFDFAHTVNKFILNKGELTMILNDKTSSGAIIGRVLLIDKDKEYVFNQRTMRLKPKEKVLPIFLYFLINSDEIHNKITALAKPGTQIYVNTNDITNLEISFPSSKAEQTTIAQILSDMDAEIEQLEQKLDKYRMIKQGMMQELLTGKTRLI